VLVDVVVRSGVTKLYTVEVYGGIVIVSVSNTVDWITMVLGEVLGKIATGLTIMVVVAVVNEAPLLGETPFSQLVVPEFAVKKYEGPPEDETAVIEVLSRWRVIVVVIVEVELTVE